MTPLHTELLARIRDRGPITVAEFMDAALYDPQHGYYTTSAQRSGRQGDFFTSVDVGPLFGELLAVQLAEMWNLLRERGAPHFHLVEAGAGNGRLTRDVLDAAAREYPDLYEHVRATLVERSAAARAAQAEALGPHAHKVRPGTATLPSRVTGVIVANELLDALPVHLVTMTPDGVREIYVGARGEALVEMTGEVSAPAVAQYVDRLSAAGAALEPGARLEVGLAAVDWIGKAAAAIDRGFLLIFDYGHPATVLSATHHDGTLTTYRSHTVGERDWLHEPGSCDLTSHVNLTAIASAAGAAGLTMLGMVDQTYFLLALGLADRVDERCGLQRRLAAKTLIVPGGLGSTIKVMAFSKGIGGSALRGVSSGRLT